MTLKAVVKQWPLSLWFWLALAVAAPTFEWVALLDAIRSVESGGNAFAIRDNSGDRSYFPTSQTDAIAKAKQTGN